MQIIVNTEKCTGCGICISVCPVDAIHLENNIAVIDYSVCDLDGICIPACPADAITLAE